MLTRDIVLNVRTAGIGIRRVKGFLCWKEKKSGREGAGKGDNHAYNRECIPLKSE